MHCALHVLRLKVIFVPFFFPIIKALLQSSASRKTQKKKKKKVRVGVVCFIKTNPVAKCFL